MKLLRRHIHQFRKTELAVISWQPRVWIQGSLRIHYKNADMNLKSTTTNGFSFRIINSIMESWGVHLTWLDCKLIQMFRKDRAALSFMLYPDYVKNTTFFWHEKLSTRFCRGRTVGKNTCSSYCCVTRCTAVADETLEMEMGDVK